MLLLEIFILWAVILPFVAVQIVGLFHIFDLVTADQAAPLHHTGERAHCIRTTGEPEHVDFVTIEALGPIGPVVVQREESVEVADVFVHAVAEGTT